MTMTRTELLQDLDFVRTIAEEGRNAPLIGGRFLVFWGVWIAAVLVAHWAIVTGRTPFGAHMLWVLWMGQGVIAGVVQALLMRSVRETPGGSAVNNRVAKAVWMSLIAAMLTIWIGVAGAVLVGGAPWLLFNILPACALMLYGVAHFVTAHFSNGDGRWASVGAFIFAAACMATVAHVETYLIAAAGALCVGFAPGLVQLMREPKATV